MDLARPALLMRASPSAPLPDLLPGAKPTCILILPLVEVDPGEVRDRYGAPAASLASLNQNQFDVFSLSQELQPLINAFYQGLERPRALWEHCLNDLYTYHFKDQYFLLRLAELLAESKPDKVFLIGAFAGPYRSPERPAISVHYNQAEASSWLLRTLFDKLGVPVEDATAPEAPRSWAKRLLRRAGFAGIRHLKLARRVLRAKKPASLPAADVVWVHRGPSEAATMKPIITCARELGLSEIHLQDDVLHAEGTAAALAREGYSYIPVGAMGGLAGFLRDIGQRAKAGVPRLKAGWLPPPLSRASLQVLFSPPVLQELAPRFGDSFLHQALLSRELGLLLASVKAKAVVTASMVDNMGPSMAWAARQQGAACIALQNALQNPESYPLMGWADKYLVQSSSARLKQIAAGCPPEKVAATGLQHLQVKAETNRALKQEAERICVTTQPLLHIQNLALIQSAAKLCQANNLELLIKLHPREDAALYAGVAEGLPCRTVLEHKTDTALALARSDLMFSRLSTTILMAIAAGTPVMVFLPPDFRHWKIDYISHPVTTACSSFDELEQAAQAALNDYPAFYAGYEKLRESFIQESSLTDFAEPPALAAAHLIAQQAGRT